MKPEGWWCWFPIFPIFPIIIITLPATNQNNVHKWSHPAPWTITIILSCPTSFKTWAHSLEGISLLWPPLLGKAIKSSPFLLYQKLSPRFNSVLVTRQRPSCGSTVMNKSTKLHKQIFVWTCLNEWMPKDGIAGSDGQWMSSFIRNCPSVSYSDYTIVHSHQQCIRIPIPFSCLYLALIWLV